jgi:hypothetical protein
MSSNFFNVGNTLEALNNAKNQVAEQNFQNALEDIQDTANEKLTLYGDIEKGSGTLLGGIAGAKAVVSGFKKFKGKLQDFKNRGKSLEERNSEGGADNDAGDAEEGLDGLTDNLTETAENLTSNLTDNLSSITDNVSNVVNNAVSQVGNTAENLVSNATNTIQDGLSGATETLQNGMDGIVNNGRNILDTLVKGKGGTDTGEVEMTSMEGRTEGLSGEAETADETIANPVDVLMERATIPKYPISNEGNQYYSGNRQVREQEQMGAEDRDAPEAPEPEVGSEDFPDLPEEEPEDFPDLPDADPENPEAGVPAEDPAGEFGGTQAEGIEGITTDTDFGVPAIDTAGEVAGEVAGEAGLEAVGAGLDATGIGAIIGIPLQILGLVGAGAGVLTGIFGSDSASNTETQQTQQAQKAEAQAKALPANVAGKFAPAIQSQAQRIVGGY